MSRWDKAVFFSPVAEAEQRPSRCRCWHRQQPREARPSQWHGAVLNLGQAGARRQSEPVVSDHIWSVASTAFDQLRPRQVFVLETFKIQCACAHARTALINNAMNKECKSHLENFVISTSGFACCRTLSMLCIYQSQNSANHVHLSVTDICRWLGVHNSLDFNIIKKHISIHNCWGLFCTPLSIQKQVIMNDNISKPRKGWL